MRVLITNDDGIEAPGLDVLEHIANQVSKDVWVVAPETDQSGASHSLTLAEPLRMRELGKRRYARLHGRRHRHGVATVGWSVPAMTLPEREPIVVHAMEGRHHAGVGAAARRAFFDATWKVTPDSNRMGFRLAGPVLAREDERGILSEPTCLGTVQVPPGGVPIALMADHQTTGGYPKIAEIASADVPRLAQLAPGGSLRFARVTLEQANDLRRALRLRVDAALRSLAWTYGEG